MFKNDTINYFSILFFIKIIFFSNGKIIAKNEIDSLTWWRDSTMELSQNNQRDYLEKALAHCREQKLIKEEALTLLRLSDWELNQANYSNAINFLDSFHQIVEKYQFTDLKGKDLLQRGNIHLGLKQYEEAKRFFEECVNLYLSDAEKSENLAESYNNLGIIEYLEKNPSTALVYYDKAGSIFKKIGDLKKWNIVLGNMALIHLQENQPQQALNYFKQQLTFYEQTNYQSSLAKTNGNIGYAYFLLNEVPTAIPFYEKCISIAKEHGFKNILAVTYKDLSETYKAIGDTKNALKNFEAYHQLETENISEKALKEVYELQIKYDKEIQDKKLVQQEQELSFLRQGKVIRQQRFYLLLAGTICLLSCSLFYYFFQKSKIKQIQFAKQLNEEKLKNQIALENREKTILKEQLTNKEKDLTSLALNISRKKDFAISIDQKLIALEKKLPEDFKPDIRHLKLFTNSQLKINDDLAFLEENIEDINHQFYDKLDSFAKFSQSEKQICGLMRLNLSNKEIALLRNTTTNSAKVFRYRIRKKLGLQPDEDIIAFLQNI